MYADWDKDRLQEESKKRNLPIGGKNQDHLRAALRRDDEKQEQRALESAPDQTKTEPSSGWNAVVQTIAALVVIGALILVLGLVVALFTPGGRQFVGLDTIQATDAIPEVLFVEEATQVPASTVKVNSVTSIPDVAQADTPVPAATATETPEPALELYSFTKPDALPTKLIGAQFLQPIVNCDPLNGGLAEGSCSYKENEARSGTVVVKPGWGIVMTCDECAVTIEAPMLTPTFLTSGQLIFIGNNTDQDVPVSVDAAYSLYLGHMYATERMWRLGSVYSALGWQLRLYLYHDLNDLKGSWPAPMATAPTPTATWVPNCGLVEQDENSEPLFDEHGNLIPLGCNDVNVRAVVVTDDGLEWMFFGHYSKDRDPNWFPLEPPR